MKRTSPVRHQAPELQGWLFGLAISLIASGCSPSPELARGPIQLEKSPTVVRLAHAVRATGPLWELCFEFEHSGDSQHAGAIRAVLLSTSGDRFELQEPELDRLGEHRVCQVGRIAIALDGEPVTFESIELSTDRPVRLRGIRGGSR